MSTAAKNNAGWLWVSAGVLAALLVLKVGGGSEAAAAPGGTVASSGNLVAMTSPTGSDEILLVLDGRRETLFVYRTDQKGVALQQRVALPALFQDARARSMGRN